MKKVVIAPDSFKGTMSSVEVCEIIEKAFNDISPDTVTVKVPVADGGEGTVDAFLAALGGEKININVKGPYFNDIESFYGILPDKKTAVVEMAAASGLPLVGEKKNPMLTTTFGTGQLIRDALDKNCTRIILGIGGSATNDGGIGMAAALGIRFLNKQGSEIELTGGGIAELSQIDKTHLDQRLNNCEIIVVCDVNNTLCGAEGASYVFGPQKGADEDMVKILDNNLIHYSNILKKEPGIEVKDIPGTGAAGGIAASLLAFAKCVIKPGIAIIQEVVGLEKAIENADLIITGEGRIDGQSIRGKVPVGIAASARKYNVPVVAIVGSVGTDADEVYNYGISAIFCIGRRPVPFEEVKLTCREDLYKTTENLIRFSKIFDAKKEIG